MIKKYIYTSKCNLHAQDFTEFMQYHTIFVRGIDTGNSMKICETVFI